MKRRAVRLVVLAAAFLLSFVALAAEPVAAPVHPDFTGKWVLDLGRSHLDARGFGDVSSGVVRIQHQEPSFSFRRSFIRGGQSDLVTFTLKTDGTEVAGTENGMPTRSSLTWSGSDLLYLVIYQAPRGEARNTVRYSLADGGRTLRAEESFRGPRLSYDNAWVFTKGE
jgi:hypothetical protein